MRIKVSNSFPAWPLLRQTPSETGKWDDCVFIINQPAGECNAWIVYDDLVAPETALCPTGATIFITGEPPSIKSYSAPFLAQFTLILSCHRQLEHPNVINAPPAVPWQVGRRVQQDTDVGFRLNYDELKTMSSFEKTKCLSVLCSNKNMTAGHRARLKFVHQLARHFGRRLDVYGRGWRDVEDKWDAIAPYQYHIVLENSQFTDYWTEKLADSYLGGAYPFYYGCPNLAEYFSKDAFTAIDITRPHEAIARIEAAIAHDQARCSAMHMENARRRVLDEYNLFPVMANLVKRCSVDEGTRRLIALRPTSAFKAAPDPPRSRWRRIRGFFAGEPANPLI